MRGQSWVTEVKDYWPVHWIAKYFLLSRNVVVHWGLGHSIPPGLSATYHFQLQYRHFLVNLRTSLCMHLPVHCPMLRYHLWIHPLVHCVLVNQHQFLLPATYLSESPTITYISTVLIIITEVKPQDVHCINCKHYIQFLCAIDQIGFSHSKWSSHTLINSILFMPVTFKEWLLHKCNFLIISCHTCQSAQKRKLCAGISFM